MSLNPYEVTEKMNEIREQVFAVVAEHEDAEHDGQPCWGTRASIVAFMAHCLGLGTRDRGELFDHLDDLLAEYDANCKTFGCGHNIEDN